MLRGSPSSSAPYPFEASGVRYFYFARNAVFVAVRALGLVGGEVLAPAFHHGVEIEALVSAGANVRFFRVGPRMDVDPADVERALTAATRAIYLIHYAGFPGPARELKEVAARRGIPLIEDCALSLLVEEDGRPVGSFGDASVFCFYKALPVPNGGALVLGPTWNAGEAQLRPAPVLSTLSHLSGALLRNLELRAGRTGGIVRSVLRGLSRQVLRSVGVDRVATGTQHFERRNADMGMSALSHRIARTLCYSRIVEARRRNFFFLLRELRDCGRPIFAELPPGACPLFFPLRVSDRDAVVRRLLLRGVEAVPFWSDFHPSCPAADFPDAAALRESVVEIPCHQDLSTDLMSWLAGAVRDAVRRRA
jgi:dTDP-4-amino-4,6-dideoxygalactose transaminase